MKSRLNYLDAVGGLMILHMIAFHIFQAGMPGTAAKVMFPLSFFMFWFFYKSGMMDKKKSCRNTIISGIRKLFIPYVVFLLLGYGVWMAKQISIGTSFDEIIKETYVSYFYTATLPGNIALWFIPSLLVVKIIFSILPPPITEKYGIGTIIFLGLLILICFLLEGKTSLPCYFKNIPLGCLAYLWGCIMKDKQFTNLAFGLSLIICITILLIYPSSISFMDNRLIMGNYMLAIIYSFAGCILINNVFLRFLPNGFIILNSVGKKSMDYYAPHMILLNLCLFAPLPLVPYLKELQCVSCIMLLPLISFVAKKLNYEWIFGRK